MARFRESQLSKLEERVTNLRSQLERRRKAKGEITQLQTKVLINDADGLGFSGASLFDDHNPLADKARAVVNPATPVAPSLPARELTTYFLVNCEEKVVSDAPKARLPNEGVS